MSTTELITADQFEQMHFAENEDFELVQGELVPVSSATPKHAKIRSRIEWALEAYLQRDLSGAAFSEVDCRVTPETVCRPDVAIFLGPHTREINPNRIPVPYRPDIAVEVLSPSESAIDVSRKAHEYLRGGVREVWILDGANREISVRTSDAIRLYRESDNLESPLLPGFSCPVADLFATYPAA